MPAPWTRQESARSRSAFNRLFPIPFLLAGVVILFLGGRNLYRAIASTAWPTAQGVIQHSSVERDVDSRHRSTYRAVVTYNFTVDDMPHECARVFFGDYGSNKPSHARRIVKAYPAGKQVTVSYNPEDLELCVLEPGIRGLSWLLPVLGVAFFGLGVFLVVYLPRQGRTRG